MMAQTAKLLSDVEEAYDAFKFNGVYRAVYDFVNDLSSVYMDVTKDRLYSEAPNSAASPRRADRAHEHPRGARTRVVAHPVVHG